MSLDIDIARKEAKPARWAMAIGTRTMAVSHGTSLAAALLDNGWSEADLLDHGAVLAGWIAHNNHDVACDAATLVGRVKVPIKPDTASRAAVVVLLTDYRQSDASQERADAVFRHLAKYGDEVVAHSHQHCMEALPRPAATARSVSIRSGVVAQPRIAPSLRDFDTHQPALGGLLSRSESDGEISDDDLQGDRSKQRKFLAAFDALSPRQQAEQYGSGFLDDFTRELIDRFRAVGGFPKIDGEKVDGPEAAVDRWLSRIDDAEKFAADTRPLEGRVNDPVAAELLSAVQEMWRVDELKIAQSRDRFRTQLDAIMTVLDGWSSSDIGSSFPRGRLVAVQEAYPEARISIVGLAKVCLRGTSQLPVTVRTAYRIEVPGEADLFLDTFELKRIRREVTPANITVSLEPEEQGWSLKPGSPILGLSASEFSALLMRAGMRHAMIAFGLQIGEDLKASADQFEDNRTPGDYLYRNYNVFVVQMQQTVAELKADFSAELAAIETKLGSTNLSAKERELLAAQKIESQELLLELQDSSALSALRREEKGIQRRLEELLEDNPTWRMEDLRQVPASYVDLGSGVRVNDLPLFLVEEPERATGDVALVDLSDGSLYRGNSTAEVLDKLRRLNQMGTGYLAALLPGEEQPRVIRTSGTTDAIFQGIDEASDYLWAGSLATAAFAPQVAASGATASVAGKAVATVKYMYDDWYAGREVSPEDAALLGFLVFARGLRNVVELARGLKTASKLTSKLRRFSFFANITGDTAFLGFTVQQLYAVYTSPDLTDKERMELVKEIVKVGGLELLLTVLKYRRSLKIAPTKAVGAARTVRGVAVATDAKQWVEGGVGLDASRLGVDRTPR